MSAIGLGIGEEGRGGYWQKALLIAQVLHHAPEKTSQKT